MVHALASGPLLALAVPLVGWRLYQRVRRNISRQPLQPRRLMLRAAVISLALGILLFWPVFEPSVALAMLGGAAGGIGLALWGVKLTRFETTAKGVFYTPNLYIGLVISLLFITRMAWRITVMWPLIQSGEASLGHIYARNPLTYGMLAVVLAYFVTYSLGVLRASRAQQPEAPTAATPA